MRSLIICIRLEKLLRRSTRGTWDGRECSTHGRDEIQSFSL